MNRQKTQWSMKANVIVSLVSIEMDHLRVVRYIVMFVTNRIQSHHKHSFVR